MVYHKSIGLKILILLTASSGKKIIEPNKIIKCALLCSDQLNILTQKGQNEIFEVVLRQFSIALP